jgi:hypothetical protein
MPADAAAIETVNDAGIGVIEALLSPDAMDKRTKPYKQFAAIVSALESDLGGDLTEIKKQLTRRLATLAVWCEAQDAAALCGDPIDADMYGRVSGHMRRLSETLGCERVPKDITHDLSAYLARTTLAEAVSAPAAVTQDSPADAVGPDDIPDPAERASEAAIEAAP